MAKEQQKDIIFRFNNVNFIFSKVHGYFAAAGVSQSLTGATGEYKHVTNATTNLFAEIQSAAGIDKADDTFVFNPASYPASSVGHISFDVHIYGTGGNNKNFEARIYNVTQAEEVVITFKFSTDGTGNVGKASGRAYSKNAAVGNVFRLELRPTAGDDNFTVTDASVWIELNHWVKI
jgi:hypothetical protein